MRKDLYDSIHGEKAVNKFLCDNLYDIIYKNHYVIADNIDAQLSGIDVVVYEEEPFSIDEKAQVGYINRPRPTFAFEISYKNRSGIVKDGWLLKNKVNPTYYGLVWIHKSKESNKGKLKASDIEKLEYMLVSNIKLQDYLYEHGIDEKKVRDISDMLRKFNQRFVYRNGFKFVYSYDFNEAPVNIVIPKSILKEICEYDYIVTPYGIIKELS